MALAGLKHGLRMVSQQALRFYNRVGYHPDEGITEDFSERERILKHLGKNRALVMHNHGLVTVGKNAREAFVLMKYLVSAASIQLQIEATGGEAIEIPADICEKAAAQFETHDAGRGSADWPAYLRPRPIRAIATDGSCVAGKFRTTRRNAAQRDPATHRPPGPTGTPAGTTQTKWGVK